jgi:hypothetical protein
LIQAKKVRRSPRGNWLVVVYLGDKIYECQYARTWYGVQRYKRIAEKMELGRAAVYFPGPIRVIVLDIERMVQFAIVESANEIHDLEALYKRGDPPTDG